MTVSVRNCLKLIAFLVKITRHIYNSLSGLFLIKKVLTPGNLDVPQMKPKYLDRELLLQVA